MSYAGLVLGGTLIAFHHNSLLKIRLQGQAALLCLKSRVKDWNVKLEYSDGGVDAGCRTSELAHLLGVLP